MRIAGLVSVCVGIAAFIYLGAKGFFFETDVPLFMKVVTGVIGIGLLVLLGKAIRDRIIKTKTEKLKEAEK